jgi:hypothetical protein
MELAPQGCPVPRWLLLLPLLLGLSAGRSEQKGHQRPVPPSLSTDESLLGVGVGVLCFFKQFLFPVLTVRNLY